jgi:sigma-E factor negative regulatory protein RseC
MSNQIRGEQLHEEGVVVGVEEGVQRYARVMMIAGEACASCSANALCKPEDAERRTLEVTDPIGVEPGDRVLIVVAGGAVLKASFLLYGLPLVMLVIGVTGGLWLLPSDMAAREPLSFAIGLGLIALSLWLVHLREGTRRAAGREVLPATILRKIEPQVQ